MGKWEAMRKWEAMKPWQLERVLVVGQVLIDLFTVYSLFFEWIKHSVQKP